MNPFLRVLILGCLLIVHGEGQSIGLGNPVRMLEVPLPQGVDRNEKPIFSLTHTIGSEENSVSYNVDNTIQNSESTFVKQVPTIDSSGVRGSKSSLVKKGLVSWVSPEGMRVRFSYQADENGYHAIRLDDAHSDWTAGKSSTSVSFGHPMGKNPYQTGSYGPSVSYYGPPPPNAKPYTSPASRNNNYENPQAGANKPSAYAKGSTTDTHGVAPPPPEESRIEVVPVQEVTPVLPTTVVAAEPEQSIAVAASPAMMPQHVSPEIKIRGEVGLNSNPMGAPAADSLSNETRAAVSPVPIDSLGSRPAAVPATRAIVAPGPSSRNIEGGNRAGNDDGDQASTVPVMMFSFGEGPQRTTYYASATHTLEPASGSASSYYAPAARPGYAPAPRVYAPASTTPAQYRPPPTAYTPPAEPYPPPPGPAPQVPGPAPYSPGPAPYSPGPAPYSPPPVPTPQAPVPAPAPNYYAPPPTYGSAPVPRYGPSVQHQSPYQAVPRAPAAPAPANYMQYHPLPPPQNAAVYPPAPSSTRNYAPAPTPSQPLYPPSPPPPPPRQQSYQPSPPQKTSSSYPSRNPGPYAPSRAPNKSNYYGGPPMPTYTSPPPAPPAPYYPPLAQYSSSSTPYTYNSSPYPPQVPPKPYQLPPTPTTFYGNEPLPPTPDYSIVALNYNNDNPDGYIMIVDSTPA